MNILIKKSIVEEISDSQIKIGVSVIDSGVSKELWYTLDSKYKDFLTVDVADGFVVAFLLYAMERNLDIISEMPMSTKLYISLTKSLIPFLYKSSKKLHSIKIKAPLTANLYGSKRVGTGISCGVDSLSTIIYHGLNEEVDTYKIDTLTLLNAGFYGNEGDTSEHYKTYLDQSRSFSSEFNYDFLSMDSNFSSLIKFSDLCALSSYFVSSMILLLQKYFKIYFLASGFPAQEFEPNIEHCARYDVFLLNCLSTESLTFYAGCSTFSRVEKVDLISTNNAVLKNLYVCLSGNSSHNCSKCEKCVRTIVELDSIGCQNGIKAAFDYDYFNKNRYQYLNYMLRHKKRNTFYQESYNSYKEHNIQIPLLAYIYIIPFKFEIVNFFSTLRHSVFGPFLTKVYNLLYKR